MRVFWQILYDLQFSIGVQISVGSLYALPLLYLLCDNVRFFNCNGLTCVRNPGLRPMPHSRSLWYGISGCTSPGVKSTCSSCCRSYTLWVKQNNWGQRLRVESLWRQMTAALLESWQHQQEKNATSLPAPYVRSTSFSTAFTQSSALLYCPSNVCPLRSLSSSRSDIHVGHSMTIKRFQSVDKHTFIYFMFLMQHGFYFNCRYFYITHEWMYT